MTAVNPVNPIPNINVTYDELTAVAKKENFPLPQVVAETFEKDHKSAADNMTIALKDKKITYKNSDVYGFIGTKTFKNTFFDAMTPAHPLFAAKKNCIFDYLKRQQCFKLLDLDAGVRQDRTLIRKLFEYDLKTDSQLKTTLEVQGALPMLKFDGKITDELKKALSEIDALIDKNVDEMWAIERSLREAGALTNKNDQFLHVKGKDLEELATISLLPDVLVQDFLIVG